MSTVNHTKIQKLTVSSILAAIVAIVSFLPLKTLGLEITFSMVPVAIGAMLYGPSAGAILGGVFGTVSFLQCLGYSAFGAALLAINPLFTLIVCIPTRILAGFLTGLIFNQTRKVFKTNTPALLISSIVSPVMNTVFFMTALVLLFYNCDLIQGFAKQLGAANPFIFIILFVGINGLVEIICGIVVAFPCAKALSKSLKL